jgi:hypothetical protein
MAEPPYVVQPTVRERIINTINNRFRRFVVNTVWGHIIYRNVRRAKFKIPFGLKTLDQFIRFHKTKLGIEQKRSDHPIALEIYYSITLDRKLTDREVAIVTAALAEELVNEFYITIVDIMEWGFDATESPFFIDTEAKKRISHNGEDFTEENIIKKKPVSSLEARLR